MPLTAYEDSRVDVCLYFVAPHNLRPLDVAMMQRIGALAPVVPIIAKVPVLASLTPARGCFGIVHSVSTGCVGRASLELGLSCIFMRLSLEIT